MTDKIQKNKGGRPPKLLTEGEAKLAHALYSRGATMEFIASHLGISEETLMKRAGDEIKAAKLEKINELQRTAFELATVDKNPAMIMFLLKTVAFYRETNRTELTGAEGAPLAIMPVDAPPKETREQWEARVSGKVLDEPKD